MFHETAPQINYSFSHFIFTRDDGGGDNTNIAIISSLHQIEILYESQPYA